MNQSMPINNNLNATAHFKLVFQVFLIWVLVIILDWILPNPEDSGKAICRFCQTILRAHRSDLVLHSKTRKHQRFASECKSKGGQENIVITIPQRYR